MSQSPHKEIDSKRYSDGWRAINLLIRSGGSWSGRERNVLFRNQGGGKFRDESFVAGLDFDGDGRSFVPLDIDHDGDQDLILKFRTGPQLRVLRNDVAAAGGSLEVELRGTKANRDAAGARAVLETNRRRLLRHVRSGSGFYSQPSRRLHFGLLPGEKPEALAVDWPGGGRERWDSLPEAQRLMLEEGRREISVSRIPEPSGSRRREPQPDAPKRAGITLLEPVPAPDFELQGQNGSAKLSAQRGKKVLLNFWATWCPPCREELQEFAGSYDEFREAGMEVLAISVDDPGEREKAAAFANELGLPFPVLFADDATVAAYSILNRYLAGHRAEMGIPTSFLINGGGEIVKLYRGAAEAGQILADANGGGRRAIPFAGRWFGGPPGRDYLTIGTEMAARGLTAEARRLFERALQKGGAGYELYNNLAGLLTESGEIERAAELLRRSLDLNPNQVDARVNLAGVLLERGEAAAAAELLEAARRSRPDDPLIYNRLGTAAFLQNDLGQSEAHFREAIRLDPEVAESHSNLGSVLAAGGRFDESLSSFEKARSLGADDAKLLSNLGAVYMQTRRPQKGLEVFEEAAEKHPQDYGARLNLAMYFLQAGDAALAEKWIVEARRIDPERPESFVLEAQLRVAQGDVEAARSILQRTRERNPGFAPAGELLRQLEGQ